MVKTRRSPVVHTVGRHKRNGKWVAKFTRGSGERSQKQTVVHKKVFNENTDMGVHAWTVNFSYPGMKPPGESVIVFSDTYDGVLDEAFDERKYQHWEPYATELIDPSIMDALRWAGRGTKKIAGLGAKYTITGLRKVGAASKMAAVEGAKYASFKVTSRLVEQLLKDVYGPPGLRRTAAKIQLQTKYPKIWDMTNLSHDRPPRRVVRKAAKRVARKRS